MLEFWQLLENQQLQFISKYKNPTCLLINRLILRPVSVGIFTTGNELKEHYEELQPGQIRDSNRLALINLLKEYHYDCDDYGIIRDE